MFLDETEAQIFVPESQQGNPQRFKHFFDTQHVDIRFTLIQASCKSIYSLEGSGNCFI